MPKRLLSAAGLRRLLLIGAGLVVGAATSAGDPSGFYGEMLLSVRGDQIRGVFSSAQGLDLNGGSGPMFTCVMRRGSVSVTELGGTLTLRLRLPRKPDTVVTGDAGHRTVLSFQDLYAGQERQLRFIDGPRSYIVYTMAGNRQTGAQAVSGLSVALGRKLTLDQPCSHYTEFTDAWSRLSLPEDSAEYSAMQFPP